MEVNTDLSIIIPHYNSPNSLKKLLDSIKYDKKYEVIVVDDKSTISLDLYNQLKTDLNYSNVLFIDNNTDKKGAGVCRNIGLKKAKGRWVLFADADDFFFQNFCEYINKYIYSEYDVIYFVPSSINLLSGQISDRHIDYEKLIMDFVDNESQETLVNLKYKYHVPWSKMISRDLILKHNIEFDECIASNDVMFSTKVGFYSKNIAVSLDRIYCVTKNVGSLTTQTSIKVFNSRLKVYINYYKFLKTKLNQLSFGILELRGGSYVTNAIKNKYGLIKIFSTYIRLKINGIRLFDLSLFQLILRRIKLNNNSKYNLN